MRIESFLPVFPGFYGTVFEADEEPMIEDGKTFDDYEWDYAEYHRRVAVACVGFIEQEFKDWGIKIEFQQIVSPREYNFTNDTINVEYRVRSLKVLRNYIQEHKEAFQTWLDENYTSRSGFISFVSTDMQDWLSDITDTHKFGAVLGFILFNENEDIEESMYYATEGIYPDGILIENTAI